MLTVRDACKSFNGINVFSNIGFTVETGSILGLAGPSGSGKSTLLRCIQGFERLDRGEIDYQGRSGFMFQDFQLFPHMSVLDNLVYAPKLTAKQPSQHQERALALLEQLGLTDKHSSFPHQLSGGQKQRVALGRGLMMKPNLMLFDEPTSGLDVASIQDVVELLDSVRQPSIDPTLTMVIASHDLDFLTRLADRIVVLKQGSLVADVDPRSMLDPIQALKGFYLS